MLPRPGYPLWDNREPAGARGCHTRSVMRADTRRPPPRPLHHVRRALLGVAATLCLALVATAAAQSSVVRVLLAVEPSVVVHVEGPHAGRVDGRRAFKAGASLAWPVTARGDALYVDGSPVGETLTLEPESEPFAFAGRRYRGAVRLSAVDGVVEVVNVLNVEDYLRGVVPSEMAASWPMEALKAQAVAARSYTLTSLDPYARYDLCATEDCQVYRGVEAEHPRTDAAIAATAGVVVTYGGSAARTYYHADSGGTVASSAEVWGTWSPYLVARADAQSPSPHRAWSLRLDGGRVGASLAAAGLDVGEVTSLRVLGLSESGRVNELEVVGSRGSRVLRGTSLTALARSWGLKSMSFRVQGGLTVTGDGWGHGVGMSQYGARALANAGYDFTQILAFYYPNTGLTRFLAEAP